jgi:hypothetical protein
LKSPERARLTLHRKGGPNQPRLQRRHVSALADATARSRTGGTRVATVAPFATVAWGQVPAAVVRWVRLFLVLELRAD